jgi:hypothetical protein
MKHSRVLHDGKSNTCTVVMGVDFRPTRKEIRRELKSLKADLCQLASEAGSKDRAWGEQVDRVADRVRELIGRV